MRGVVVLTLVLWLACGLTSGSTSGSTSYGSVDMSDYVGELTLNQCLNESRTAKYGFSPLASSTSDKPTIKIEFDAWDSHYLPSYVTAYLLQDVLGLPVAASLYGGGRTTYPRVAAGIEHINVEVWPTNKLDLYDQYVREDHTVEDYGTIGYIGRNGWFVPKYLVDSVDDLFLDFWRSFLTEEAMDIFPKTNEVTTGTYGSDYVCQESYCTDGVYVPPQCADDPNECITLLQAVPAYATLVNERMIASLGINATVNYLGYNGLLDEITTRGDSEDPFVTYFWMPSATVAVEELVRVVFPENTPSCYNEFNEDPLTATLDCDWPIDFLHKIVSSELADLSPAAAALVEAITIQESDLNSMMVDADASGDSADAACQWLIDNEETWSSWIPSSDNLEFDATGDWSLPSCLPESFKTKYGYDAYPPSSKPSIKVEMNGWGSHRIPSLVTATLLQDVMNYNVELPDYIGGVSTYPRIAEGTTHINMEVWPNNKIFLYDDYVRSAGTVEDLGSLGYLGRIGWYMPSYTVDRYPEYILDFWRAFTTPEGVGVFPPGGSVTPAHDGSGDWLCDDPRCEAGHYAPTQCAGDLDSCATLIHFYPTWTQYANERLIDTLGLNVTVSYLGPNTTAYAEAAVADERDFVMYYWWPDLFASRADLERVVFPENTPGCFDDFNADPLYGNLACDQPVELLHKIVYSELENIAPDVYDLVDKLVLGEGDLQDIMVPLSALAAPSQTDFSDEVCNWITANEATWSAWIPEAAIPASASCVPGTFRSNVTGECESCPPGTIAPVANSVSCSACAEGFFAASTRSCEPCPAGSYSTETGQFECLLCEPTQYAPNNGSTGCMSCPKNELIGYLGGVDGHECTCDVNYWRNSKGKCVACPTGGVCEGGESVPYARKGYWHSDDDEYNFYECLNADACPGGDASTCSDLYEGELCGRCRKGTYATSEGCFACGKIAFLPFLLVMFIIAVLFVVIVGSVVKVFKNPAYRERAKTYIELTALVSIAVDFVQMLSVLKTVNGWSPLFRSFLSAASLLNFNLEFLQIECVFGVLDYGAVYTSRVAAPLAMAILGMLIIWMIDNPSLRNDFIAISLLFVKFLYISVLTNVAQLFLCYESQPGVWSLRADPSITCFTSDRWLSLLPIAITGLLLYGIGVIGAFSYLLYKWKTAEVVDETFQDRYAAPLGLYNFRSYVYFWQIVVLVRKFVIGFLVPSVASQFQESSASGTSNSMSIAFFLLGFVVFFAVQVHFRPYRWSNPNWLENQFLFALIVLLLFFSGDSGASFDLVAVYFVIVSLVVIAIAWYIGKSYRDNAKEAAGVDTPEDVAELFHIPSGSCDDVSTRDGGESVSEKPSWYAALSPEDRALIQRVTSIVTLTESAKNAANSSTLRRRKGSTYTARTLSTIEDEDSRAHGSSSDGSGRGTSTREWPTHFQGDGTDPGDGTATASPRQMSRLSPPTSGKSGAGKARINGELLSKKSQPPRPIKKPSNRRVSLESAGSGGGSDSGNESSSMLGSLTSSGTQSQGRVISRKNSRNTSPTDGSSVGVMEDTGGLLPASSTVFTDGFGSPLLEARSASNIVANIRDSPSAASIPGAIDNK